MSEKKDIAVQAEPRADARLLQVVGNLAEGGASVEMVQSLVAIYQAERERAAQVAYTQAMARVQSMMPRIAYTAKASVGTYGYKYTPLDDVLAVAGPVLAGEGFSWRWEYVQETGSVTSTCVLEHAGGASRRATFSVPVVLGKGNPAHAIASARTYGARYAFISVTGVMPGGEDSDANQGAAVEGAAGPTTEELQAAHPAALLALQAATDYAGLRDAYKGLSAVARASVTAAELQAEKDRVNGVRK